MLKKSSDQFDPIFCLIFIAPCISPIPFLSGVIRFFSDIFILQNLEPLLNSMNSKILNKTSTHYTTHTMAAAISPI